MDNAELQKRIDASPELQQLTAKFSDVLSFHNNDVYGIDPFLLLTAIGIIINILLHCKERKPELLKRNIRNIRTLSRFRLRRLRRELSTLWCGADPSASMRGDNPLLSAVYEVGELATDEELDALLAVVKEARRS